MAISQYNGLILQYSYDRNFKVYHIIRYEKAKTLAADKEAVEKSEVYFTLLPVTGIVKYRGSTLIYRTAQLVQ
jgi:hypothetical protein